jgi:osmotically-inducible protein OsmY
LFKAIFSCEVVLAPLFVANSQAQQVMPGTPSRAASAESAQTTDRSLTIEHDNVQTPGEHLYHSPAERARDDLLITEVKRSLAEQGIADRYPVEVDCDHGTIELSGVVASPDAARQAAQIASNTQGVVGVRNKLTLR